MKERDKTDPKKEDHVFHGYQVNQNLWQKFQDVTIVMFKLFT